MSEPLRSALGNSQLLDWYGDVQLDTGLTFRQAWDEALELNSSEMFRDLRQQMLLCHKDCVPEDVNWR